MRVLTLALLASLLPMAGCSSHAPMKTVDHVDLQRFMGDWYVVANIPTFIEVGAHNAVESYAMNEDGTVATTFTFRDGSFDGERKEYNPKGFIVDGTGNALWGMQFIWPIKADYRIVYLDDDYTRTVIAREARDYVWFMSRDPVLSDEEFARMTDFVRELGYDVANFQRVPQRWPGQESSLNGDREPS